MRRFTFSWQLLALGASAVLFVAVLLTRNTGQQPSVPPTPSPAAAVADLQPTAEEADAAVDVVALPTMTPVLVSEPESTQNAPLSAVTGTDGVPTYREALIGRVQRLNPLFATMNAVDADITSLIFEGLTAANDYGEIVPRLAKSWVVSSDGREYVVTLREDVLWQDGERFSADDVVFTMAILRDKTFPGTAATRNFWRTVETEKLGDYLIRFRLAQPLGSFLDALRIGILPYHAFVGAQSAQLATHPFNFTPIGTGAYQLEALRRDNTGTVRVVDLRVAPNYRQRAEGQGAAYGLERVRFVLYDTFEEALEALKNGEVDGLAGRNSQERPALLEAANTGTVSALTSIEPTTGFLIYNWRDNNFPVFRDQRLRQALAISLDRRSIVERWLFNTAIVANSPILYGSWAYLTSIAWPQTDIARARDLLATAKIEIPSEETDASEETAETPTPESTALLTFTILTPDDPVLLAVAEEITKQWALVGIDASVEPADLATYRERLRAGQFQAAIVELTREGSADPDVYDFWHQGQIPSEDNPGGRNFGGADDRGISEPLERARREPVELYRKAYFDEFQEKFVDGAIALPLYTPLYTYAVTSRIENVQIGFISAPSDRFRSIGSWSIPQS